MRKWLALLLAFLPLIAAVVIASTMTALRQSAAQVPQLPDYRWVNLERESPNYNDQIGLFRGQVQVGLYVYSEKTYYPIVGKEWGEPAVPPWPLPEAWRPAKPPEQKQPPEWRAEPEQTPMPKALEPPAEDKAPEDTPDPFDDGPWEWFRYITVGAGSVGVIWTAAWWRRRTTKPDGTTIEEEESAIMLVKKVTLPKTGQQVTFTDRQTMKKGHPTKRFILRGVVPQPPVPPDWFDNLQYPMLGNDRLGDCMAAAAGHAQGMFTGNNGTEWLPNEADLESWYTAGSGGDNGLDEGTLITMWKAGVANDKTQAIVDAADIDTTDPVAVAAATYYFGGVLFMLDVPDSWITAFTGNGGDVWDGPATPDQNNGHGVWWTGIDAQGRRRLLTWGSWVFLTQAGVKSCDPSGFVVFAPKWFNAAGYAPNKLHITQLAALWTQFTGGTIPASVINAFPPPVPGPAPGPTPAPPPGPAPSPGSGIPFGEPVVFNPDGTYTEGGASGKVLQPDTIALLERDLGLSSDGIVIPPFILTILKYLCPLASLIPAPIGPILVIVCGLIPHGVKRVDGSVVIPPTRELAAALIELQRQMDKR